MEQYQLFYLASPEIQDLEAEDLKMGVESFLKERGEVKLTEKIKKIKLAYPVKKQTEAFFGFVFFETSPEKIAELKTMLDNDKKIIRHLIIKEPMPAKPEERVFIKPRKENEDGAEKQAKEEKPTKKKKEEAKADLANFDEELDKVLNL